MHQRQKGTYRVSAGFANAAYAQEFGALFVEASRVRFDLSRSM
jgi:hypothetical protein